MNKRKGKKFCKKCLIPIPNCDDDYLTEEDKQVCKVCTCNPKRQKTPLILYGNVVHYPRNYCFTGEDAQKAWSEEMSHICPGDGLYYGDHPFKTVY
jgi:hypothetical protein